MFAGGGTIAPTIGLDFTSEVYLFLVLSCLFRKTGVGVFADLSPCGGNQASPELSGKVT